MHEPDSELERDIGYALAQSAFKAKGQRIEALRLVAAGVVAHLRRAGWRFALKPPEAAHGPSSAEAAAKQTNGNGDEGGDTALS
jgi:hypothetical protein